MRFDKLSIAAWILSLATDPTRATATVGDFAEESRAHGRTWFWRQILRTLGAYIVDDFATSPARLLLGTLAALAYSVLAVIFAVGTSFFAAGLWFESYYKFAPIPNGTIPQPPGDIFIVAPIVVFAHLIVGRRIVDSSRHPLAVWVLWAMCCTALWAAISISKHQVGYYPLFSMALVLTSVIRSRRRSLKLSTGAR